MALYPAPATWCAFWWIAESWLSFSSMAGSVVVTRPLRPGAAAGDSDGRPWCHGRLGVSWFRTRLTGRPPVAAALRDVGRLPARDRDQLGERRREDGVRELLDPTPFCDHLR